METTACTPANQLLDRHIDLFQDKRVLICGEFYHTCPSNLMQTAQSLTQVTTRRDVADRLNQHTPQGHVIFDPLLPTDTHFDIVLIYMPKAKELLHFLMAQALPVLTEQGQVLVVGENRSGVRSLPKYYKHQPQYIVNKIDSAKHCCLYTVYRPQQIDCFCMDDWWKTYSVEHDGVCIDVWTLPGVFSQTHADAASLLLLKDLPLFSGERVLDFGCGAGILGVWLAKRYPHLTLHLIDVDALALTSSQKTCQANGVSARIYASNVFSHIEEKFDYLITNPPFHTGQNIDFSHSASFLKQAADYLSAQGSLYLVANSFIQYKPLMADAFDIVEELSKTKSFCVYHAKKI